MTNGIRRILNDHARLSVDADSIDPAADLYDAGMNSHASVNVMIALEDEFGIEFPDSMLRRATFASVDAIAGAVAHLQEAAA